MKRSYAFTEIIALILLMFTLSACGDSEFGLSKNTEKHMTIVAKDADKDAFFMVGTLEVDAGDQIFITSNLKSGQIKVEIVGAPEENIDQFPEIDSTSSFTARITGSSNTSGTVPAGSYMLRATCMEKADGTIQIEVKP